LYGSHLISCGGFCCSNPTGIPHFWAILFG